MQALRPAPAGCPARSRAPLPGTQHSSLKRTVAKASAFNQRDVQDPAAVTSHIARLTAPSAQERAVQTDPFNGSMPAKIKVIGCGGGGSNAVNRMAKSGIKGVGLYVLNTDAQALAAAEVPQQNRLQIGRELTRGLGAGGNPEIGMAAARESKEQISKVIQGCDMVFVTAGMGGGTGSGSAPEVARQAKGMGILTVGIVTLPFTFEGRLRRQQALDAVNRLREAVDTIIVVPNDKLLQTVPGDVSVMDAFKMADAVLQSGVRGISDIIQLPGLVNVDFADVKTIMTNAGTALMGQGVASGKGRAAEAARAALSSPLLDVDIGTATGIVWNITGPRDMTLFEVRGWAAC